MVFAQSRCTILTLCFRFLGSRFYFFVVLSSSPSTFFAFPLAVTDCPSSFGESNKLGWPEERLGFSFNSSLHSWHRLRVFPNRGWIFLAGPRSEVLPTPVDFCLASTGELSPLVFLSSRKGWMRLLANSIVKLNVLTFLGLMHLFNANITMTLFCDMSNM